MRGDTVSQGARARTSVPSPGKGMLACPRNWIVLKSANVVDLPLLRVRRDVTESFSLRTLSR
jgi:hypothetical protein